MRGASVVVGLSVLFVAVVPARSAEVGDLACIEEMVVPPYSFIARRAQQPGTVKATIRIGPNGSMAGLELNSPDKDLALEVETFVKLYTVFRADCNGKVVTLVFTFRLEGPPVLGPTVRVWFRGPNHFVIVSQPQAPIIN